jgi:uncharacterized protein (DUF952 family)
VLHIAREQDWTDAQASGTYTLPGGVIHGCSASQLARVVELHFPERSGWLVLTVDESHVAGEIRQVTFRDGGRSETFPHLHGTFPVAAVTRVAGLAETLAALN